MDYATTMKNNILSMLRDAENSKDYVTEAESVLKGMMLCYGVWIEAGYGYKAQEIAKMIDDRATDLLDTCQHYKTKEKLIRVRVAARSVAEFFWRHHQKHMQGE